MSPHSRTSRRRRHQASGGETPGRRRRWQAWVVGLTPVLLLLTGDAQPVLVKGLFLFVVGAWCLLRPPVQVPSRGAEAALWGMLLALAAAFLPAGLTGRPEWRVGLERAGIELPGFITPQPWVSLEALLLTLGAVLFFLTLWNVPMSRLLRRSLVWLPAVGTALLALVFLVVLSVGQGYLFAARTPWLSLSANPWATWGFLAAGSAVLFALGSAPVGIPKRSIGALMLLLVPLPLAGLLLAGAELAFLAFAGGGIVWYALRWTQRPVEPAFALSTPVLLGCAVLAFFLLVPLAGPLDWRAPAERSQPVAVAGAVLADAWVLAGGSAPTGMGVGNFEAVFPVVQVRSAPFAGAPVWVNDWLRLFATGGGAAVLALAVALVLLLRGLFPLVPDRDHELRSAAVAGLAALLLASLVAAPGHALALGCLASVLYRAAAARLLQSRPALMPAPGYRLAGGVLAAFGAVWMLAGLAGLPWHSQTLENTARARVAVVEQEAAQVRAQLAALEEEEEDPFAEEADGQDLQRQQAQARRREAAGRVRELLQPVISRTPLAGWVYQEAGEAALRIGYNWPRAESMFERALASRPFDAELARRQGSLAAPADAAFSAQRFACALDGGLLDVDGTVEALLQAARENPRLMSFLPDILRTHPELQLRFLLSLDDGAFRDWVASEAYPAEPAAYFGPRGHLLILERLMAVLPPAEAAALLAGNEDLPAPWYLQAVLLASESKFREAVGGIDAVIEAPAITVSPGLEGQSIAQLKRGLDLAPQDVRRLTALLKAQVESGETAEALRTISRLYRDREPPLYALYWKGAFQRDVGDYFGAWQAWRVMLRRYLLGGEPDEPYRLGY